MAFLHEVENSLNVLTDAGVKRRDVSILHTTTSYPTPMKDVNLRAMKTLSDTFKCDIGYSDHTQGIEVAVAAVALGAKIIEKHFTLNRDLIGPDHKSSLEPQELNKLVRSIKNIELAFGNPDKKPSESEMENIVATRKSIVASKNIKKGDIFSEKNLTTKRPGNGLSPMKWREIIGTIATQNYDPDDLI